jgi:hypothetical protein
MTPRTKRTVSDKKWAVVSVQLDMITDSIVTKYHKINSRVIRNRNKIVKSTNTIQSVRVTLRLEVYRQSVRFGDKPLETHDQ